MMRALWELTNFLADSLFLLLFYPHVGVWFTWLSVKHAFAFVNLPVLSSFATGALWLLMLCCGICAILENLALGKGFLQSLLHPQLDSFGPLLVKIQGRIALLNNELQKKLDSLHAAYHRDIQAVKVRQSLCEEAWSESGTRLLSSISDILHNIDVSAILTLLECPGLFAFYLSLLWAFYQILQLPYSLLRWTFRR